MKKVPLSIIILILAIAVVITSRVAISNSLDKLEDSLQQIKVEDYSEASVLQTKTTYAQMQWWLLLVADRDTILAVGVSIYEIDTGLSADELTARRIAALSQINRARQLLLATL